ncbi:MAG: response regulator [Anaerolineae bacterium]|jgi:two-component system, cell cycle response regulator DivK|nr:response regulator [Anaerolineae bacterium]
MTRLLYIEDNKDNRMLVRRILLASDYEFELREADNARDGIAMAEQDPPDMILMDISMPDMDGLTATRTIRANPILNNVLVIALTANAMQGDKEKTLEAGCDGYIRKPVDVDRLPDEIMSYIRSRA